MKKSPVNFGPQKRFYWLTLSRPSGFFGETTFRPLGGVSPLKFSYALEIDQALIAHTQMGMGVPQNFWSRKFQIWPKIQRYISPYNFGASEVSSQPDAVMNFGPQTKTL